MVAASTIFTATAGIVDVVVSLPDASTVAITTIVHVTASSSASVVIATASTASAATILAITIDVVIVYTIFAATPAAAAAASSSLSASAAVTGFAASIISKILISVTVSHFQVTVAVVVAVAANVATAADPTTQIDLIPCSTNASPDLA